MGYARGLLEGIGNFRKLKRLLEDYGFRQESGGKHLKFVDDVGGKVTVPRHGGGGTLAKGTLRSIGKRVQELIAKLDKYTAKQ